VRAIDILAAVGADLSQADDWKLTPVDYAAQGRHQEAVEALQRHIAAAQAPPASPVAHSTPRGSHAPSESQTQQPTPVSLPGALGS
ncbi:unnamed protein product, partial [Effrenium voratum]